MAATLHFTLQPLAPSPHFRALLAIRPPLSPARQFGLMVRGTKTPGLDRAGSGVMNVPQWQEDWRS